MRYAARRNRAFTLPEMGMAIAVSAIVVLIGWAMIIFAWRVVYQNRVQSDAQRVCFNVVQMIEEDVMRGTKIEIPDPDYTSVPSIQVRIPGTGTATLRRAYRFVSGNVIVQYKDEGIGPYTAFGGVTSMAFAYVNAPTNSIAQTTCTMTAGGATIQVVSTAYKRN